MDRLKDEAVLLALAQKVGARAPPLAPGSQDPTAAALLRMFCLRLRLWPSHLRLPGCLHTRTDQRSHTLRHTFLPLTSTLSTPYPCPVQVSEYLEAQKEMDKLAGVALKRVQHFYYKTGAGGCVWCMAWTGWSCGCRRTGGDGRSGWPASCC